MIINSSRATAVSLGLALLCLLSCRDADEEQHEKRATGVDCDQPHLWSVATSDGTTRAYLFGSIHMGHVDGTVLDKAVVDAVKRSDYIAFESEWRLTGGLRPPEWRRHRYYGGGMSIREDVDKDTLALLSTTLDQNDLETSFDETMRPWYLSQVLLRNIAELNGLRIYTGLDSVVRRIAEKLDLEVKFLKDSGLPASTLGEGMSNKLQEQYLRHTLEQLSNSEERSRAILEQYNSGGLQPTITTCPAEKSKNTEICWYLQRHQKERDAELASAVSRLILGSSDRKGIIVVGANHLMAEGSLLDGLRSKGFGIKRVNCKGAIEVSGSCVSDWYNYEDPELGFRVEFPAKPDRIESAYSVDGKSLKKTTIIASGATWAYAVDISEVPKKEWDDFNGAVKKAASYWIAKKARKSGSDNVGCESLQLNKLRGYRCNVRTPGSELSALVAGQVPWVYRLAVSYSGKARDSSQREKMKTKFLGSFVIKDVEKPAISETR